MTFYFESAYEATRDITVGALHVAKLAVLAAADRILAPIDERLADACNVPEDE